MGTAAPALRLVAAPVHGDQRAHSGRRGLHVRVAPLAEDDVLAIDGTAWTSPARTIADCLRTVPGRDGLALADAALHRGLTTAAAVLQVLNRQSRWPGVSKARRVLALANPRRESPLESWSAWAFAHTEVPMPIWQAEIRGPDGSWIGRADCWWPDGAVVGEADGRAKYALAAAERGGDARALYDVLQAERRRERRLREVGADVVRWATGDVVREPAARMLAHRIGTAITQGQDSGRFIGVVTSTKLPPATGESP